MPNPSCSIPSPPSPSSLSSTPLCPSLCPSSSSYASHLAQLLEPLRCPYQALLSSAMPVRDATRRREGSLAALSHIGWSHSLRSYAGFPLLPPPNRGARKPTRSSSTSGNGERLLQTQRLRGTRMHPAQRNKRRRRDRISTAGLITLVIAGFFGAVIFDLALGWTPGRDGKHPAASNNIKQRREHDGTDHRA